VLSVCVAAEMLAGCGVSPRPVIGSANEYGAFYGWCRRSEQDFLSGSGTVAALRQVECSGGDIVSPASRDYFIFVHKLGDVDADNRGTLVFGYREWSDSAGWRLEPRLTWTSNSSLRIGLSVPSFITTKRNKIDSIHVTYVWGGTDTGDEVRLPTCTLDVHWCDE
jgi:hypothetical protein